MPLDILALIGMAVAGIGAAAVVAVFQLTIDMLVNWFRERAARQRFDSNKAAVTVLDAMNNGRVAVVQGIFDKSRGTFDEARRIDAAQLDNEVRGVHSYNRVAIWQ